MLRGFFTAAILALYRLGSFIPVPGVDINAVKESQNQFADGGILNLLNTFTGGGLSRVALFALGIMPYITASIILQLLTVVSPSLEKLQKEGEVGQHHRVGVRWIGGGTLGDGHGDHRAPGSARARDGHDPGPEPAGVAHVEAHLAGQVVGPADGRGVLGEDGLRRSRGELDAHDGLEVVTGVEGPVDRQALGREAPAVPEALHRNGIVRRVGPPEPRAEGRAGRVVVDDVRRAAPAYDAVELGEPGLTPRSEEVGPAGVDDVDRRVGDGQ